MDTGFNYYHGADPAEYDLVVSNSEGGLERLRELGARRAEAVFWGADPELFAPQPVEKEYDVFFYGYGDKFRREWMAALVGEPCRRCAGARLRARRPRLPRRHRPRAADRRRPVQRLRARDLGGADQPQRHAALARDRRRLLDVPAVRARRRRARRSSRTRTRGSSAGSSRGASSSSSTTPTRRSPPTASCSPIPAQAEELGRARARARARRAHVRAPRAAAARADRARPARRRPC